MGFQVVISSKHTQLSSDTFCPGPGECDTQTWGSGGEFQDGDTDTWEDAALPCRCPGSGSPWPEVPVHGVVHQLGKLPPGTGGTVLNPARTASAGVQPPTGWRLVPDPRCHHSPPRLCRAAQKPTGRSKRAPICSPITILSMCGARRVPLRAAGLITLGLLWSGFAIFSSFPKRGGQAGARTDHFPGQEHRRDLAAGRSGRCHLRRAVCLQSTATFCLLPSEMKLHDAGAITGKHFCHLRRYPQLYGLLNVN